MTAWLAVWFDPYDVGNSYLKSHPLDKRKLGFGTRDAPKKGEFMSQQRAAQVRQTYSIFHERYSLLECAVIAFKKYFTWVVFTLELLYSTSILSIRAGR